MPGHVEADQLRRAPRRPACDSCRSSAMRARRRRRRLRRPPRDRCVEPRRGVAARSIQPCRRLERRGEAERAGQILGARRDSPAPARRSASSIARSRTSSAPIPGGPPNLCAETAIRSASGSGSLPGGICAQSASSSPPASRTARADRRRAAGCTPVSLLTDWIATSAPPGRASAPASASTIDRAVAHRPAAPAASGAARSTASCSTAEISRRSAFARPSAIASASLAPAGEDHLARPAERRRDPRARILERGARRAALGVRATRGWPSAQALAPSPRAPPAAAASSRRDRDRCGCQGARYRSE